MMESGDFDQGAAQKGGVARNVNQFRVCLAPARVEFDLSRKCTGCGFFHRGFVSDAGSRVGENKLEPVFKYTQYIFAYRNGLSSSNVCIVMTCIFLRQHDY